MDSMRSLNTSLPSSTSFSQPPEQLLQSFKAAALSVTNLYKSAITDQAQAKQLGYQEAIQDLLQFLDRKNLGLGDGEGWQVRQWATERLDGVPVNSESDDEDKPVVSSSPAVNRKEQSRENDQSRRNSESTSLRADHTSSEQQPPVSREQPETSQSTTTSDMFPKAPVFTFTAGPAFPPIPQDVDMQTSDNMPMTPTSQDETTGVGISVLPRTARTSGRLSSSNRRTSANGTVLGSKRKVQFPDFFDLSGLNGREFFGGGKRGRFT
ncbi:hypothetical protein UA08_00603 [Talaromyces atroroseus]|uniref:Uncharacterized protein n=1 Tax=Talaromyces atroroseus TaxID=1441469 RepID=A0A225B1A7_TALAT|nr:hypothetical protein UA08_00603 [Talaromyces atroroseus]OKL64494.1 hypothetical protein UA08_00603 [Talaromyces atroroseus]